MDCAPAVLDAICRMKQGKRCKAHPIMTSFKTKRKKAEYMTDKIKPNLK